MPCAVPSTRPQFAGFSDHFDRAIAPYLAEEERTRAKAVTNVLILGGAAAILVVALLLFGPFGPANLQATIAPIMLGGAGCAFILGAARRNITHGLIDRIARGLGYSYRGALEWPPYHQRFRELKLLPDHNRESWEDEVSGEHSGIPFVVCEAHLKYKTSGKNSSTRTVFHGQLLVIEDPKPFLGTTVVQRDLGLLNLLMKPGSGFSRVGLVSSEFEKAFEAWSTDQVEARELLDPVVLERFLELERLYGGKKLRAAFDRGAVLIAIETGDRLTIGSMFKPFKGADRVETILKEFDVIFDLIDVLLKRVGRLDGAFSVADVKDAEALRLQ